MRSGLAYVPNRARETAKQQTKKTKMKNPTSQTQTQSRSQIKAGLKQRYDAKLAAASEQRKRDRQYEDERKMEVEYEERGENYWADQN